MKSLASKSTAKALSCIKCSIYEFLCPEHGEAIGDLDKREIDLRL
jgi:hypothetical protein